TAEVAAGGAGGLVRVPRPNGGAHAVMVAPLFLDGRLDNGRRQSRGTLFVIHDPLGRLPPAPQLIAELFRLPLGSATLLAALAAGEELTDYAMRAGIPMNTVRFHLTTAYAPNGTRRPPPLLRSSP